MKLDNNNILWLSTLKHGVFRIIFPQKQFRLTGLSFFPDKAILAKNFQNGIRGLYQARNGDIWVGSRWGNLYQLDKEGNLKQVFSKETNSYIGNVYHVMEDDRSNLWFSTKGNGLVKAVPDPSAPQGFRLSFYKNVQSDLNSISSNDVYCTYRDSRGRIWAGLFGGGVNLLWDEGDKGVTFKHKYNSFGLYPSHGLYMDVRNIIEDDNGRIWVGTTDGLMSFDSHFDTPESIVFNTYKDINPSSNLINNDVLVTYKDSDSEIWMSVFGGGISKITDYDENYCPVLKNYGVNDGINTDVIVSIVEDDKKHLWLISETGISCFDKNTGMFRNYDKYDGLPNIQMEDYSAMKTHSGEIWLGSREGILRFDPDNLLTSNYDFKTYIVNLRISNRDIKPYHQQSPITRSIKYTDSILLEHDQSMFTIEFATLNFYDQNRFFYKYILEGYEKEWHYADKNRIASYTNVPPGHYTFYVQSIDGANPEHVSEKKMNLTILPPWWKTAWAYVAYFVAAIALLVALARLVYLMFRMKNDVYIQQKLSELKIKFFTNISHELRTPLTLIKGPVQELKNEEIQSEKGLRYIRMIDKNVDQMLNLVNQILDFRKIQNGKMRLHVSALELKSLVESFRSEFQELAKEKNINYTFWFYDEPVMLWGDKMRLETVVRNIISNAFKFTPDGGDIFVSAGLSDDNESCYIRVEDTGIGIKDENPDNVFERFHQGDNVKDTSYPGTGIGLALSKEIVELHHGSIKVDKNIGRGTVFTVNLRTDKAHFNAKEVDFYVGDNDSMVHLQTDDKADFDTYDSHLPAVLIVEDNPDLCTLLKMQLEDLFNVYMANNATEGLKKIHQHNPDIIISDLMMPEIDGLDLVRMIRKDFNISHIPVIILTAKHSEEAKTEAIKLGANAYITKPFGKEHLVAQLEQLLWERKLFRERIKLHLEGSEPSEGYNHFLIAKDAQFLDNIYKIIEDNLDNCNFNIDTIASSLGLSRSTFFKKLKSLTGLAPVDLVKDIRLSKSTNMLKSTDMSITEVAYAVGFSDSSYFSKCFRKKYNQAPREYINVYRIKAKQVEPPPPVSI